ncbi:unnamed protein product [Ectocarpus sp. 4 AP-2014]
MKLLSDVREGVDVADESESLGSLSATLAVSSGYHISKIAPKELVLLARLVSG